MPKFYAATAAEFEEFERELFKREFRRITRAEVIESLGGIVVSYGQSKMFPRRERGFENGYLFSCNGLEVVVWTSWLDGLPGLRNMDQGWVLIRDCKHPECPSYFAVPRHRTKNFLTNLLEDARVAAWRVRHRPKCPACGEFMDITRRHRKDGTVVPRARFWKCSRISLHQDGKPRTERWDCMFTKEQKALVEKRRRTATKQRAKRAAQGKETFVSLKRQQEAARRRRQQRSQPPPEDNSQNV